MWPYAPAHSHTYTSACTHRRTQSYTLHMHACLPAGHSCGLCGRCCRQPGALQHQGGLVLQVYELVLKGVPSPHPDLACMHSHLPNFAATQPDKSREPRTGTFCAMSLKWGMSQLRASCIFVGTHTHT